MDETQLWMMQTDLRLQVLEALIVRLQLMVPLLTKSAENVEASLHQSLELLDEISRTTDRMFSGREFEHLDYTQRARAVDEMRNIIDGLGLESSRQARRLGA